MLIRFTRDKAITKKSLFCRICGKPVTEKKCTVHNYDFYQCSNCYFIFCPSLTQDFLNHLYASGYHNSEDGAPEDGWAKVEHIYPSLQYLRKTNADLLDFGCGESKIPDLLRKNGYSVTGIDIAPPVREQESRLTGSIVDLKLPQNNFDLIYSIQVFEHIPDPVPIIGELLRILRPGGYLFVHTDMETKERFEKGFKNWSYVAPPDHCVFYRNRTFEVLLKDKPHQIVFENEKKVLIRKVKQSR